MHCRKGLCPDLAAAVREHCKIRQDDHPDRVSLYGRGPLHHEPQSYPEIRTTQNCISPHCLYLFGAGREKKIYAVPPHTSVVSLAFDDVPFERENFHGKKCRLCGSTNTYLDEMYDAETGEKFYQCSDTAYCKEVRSREL